MYEDTTKKEGTSAVKTRSITIELIAENMAFNKNTITVSASARVKIVFNNKDEGVPHNFALYEDESAAKSIFVGKIIKGPMKIDYEFTAPANHGSYFFRCDVHPRTMTGTFIVK